MCAERSWCISVHFFGSKKVANKIDTIIFDLDGTLVDSAADLYEALNQTLTECGRNPVNVNSVKGMIGDGIAKLVERGFAAIGTIPPPEELEALVAGYKGYYNQVS